MRARVDALVPVGFVTVHARSTTDALHALRRRPVRAFLVSPSALSQEELIRVRGLMMRSANVLALAVVSGRGPVNYEALLELGACGVRSLLDLSARESRELFRDQLTMEEGKIATAILEELIPALGETRAELKQFFGMLVRLAPTVATAEHLAEAMGMRSGTLETRFHGAKLPSPKRYLFSMRLLYVWAFLETPGVSHADVARRLGYASPKRFGGQILTALGLTPDRLGEKSTVAFMVEHFVAELVLPFAKTLRSFNPFGDGRGRRGVLARPA
jgi:AraC-like DNA-binding protein